MTSPFTGAAASRTGAKRRHTEEDGYQSTKASEGSEGAFGLTRGELDELTVRVAQVVSIHDVQIREHKACLYRRVIMSATGKCGEKFVAVEEQWNKDRGEHSQGAMGSKHLRLAIALIEEAYNDHQLGADARTKLDAVFLGVNLNGDTLGTKVRVM